MLDVQTVIELSDSSSIDFSCSIIEICKEIKTTQNENVLLLNDELNAKLFCGYNFNCSSWVGKYLPNDVFLYSKCIDDYNGKNCLFTSNKKEEAEKPKCDKKEMPISTGKIIAKVVVMIIVIVRIIVGICSKKKSRKNKNEDEFTQNHNENQLDL